MLSILAVIISLALLMFLAYRGVTVLLLAPLMAALAVVLSGDARWLLHAPGGADESVPVRGPLRTNNLSTILAACRAGMGLAMLPWYVARESVVEGHIVPVLQDHALPAQEMHAVFPSPKLVPAKVTGFIAWLQQQLDGPWWTRAF